MIEVGMIMLYENLFPEDETNKEKYLDEGWYSKDGTVYEFKVLNDELIQITAIRDIWDTTAMFEGLNF